MSEEKRGYFIVFEGIDGIGKSTVFSFLKERLQASHANYLFTHEPTDGTKGKKIYNMLRGNAPMVGPEALQRLYVEDRKEHIAEVIAPNLKTGKIVISDRYWLSTFAFGMLTEPQELFTRLHREIIGDAFIMPDCTILLDAPAEIAIERLGQRSEKADFFEKLEKQKRVRDHYLELAASGIEPNIIVIDAIEKPEAVASSAWTSLQSVIHLP